MRLILGEKVRFLGSRVYGELGKVPDKARYVVLEGSTRSTKTYSIEQKFVLMCHNRPGLTINCFRADEKRHTKTTIKDLREIISNFKSIGVPLEIEENKMLKQFSFSNGSEMGFYGTRDILTAHGLKQHIAWENEVMEISYAAHKQIAQRTSEKIYFDFNPSLNHHWIFDKILNDGYLKSGRTHYIHSTYKDNTFLSEEQVLEIEQYDPSNQENVINRTASEWHWDVYGLGKRGRIEGVIFPQWEIVPDDHFPPPEMFVRHGGGLDFGFRDKAALIEPGLYQDALWLKERMYESSLIITKNQSDPDYPSIQLRLEEMAWPKTRKIYADCAKPDSIQDLRLSGYNVIPSTKGADSIMFGINLVKTFRILVAESSLNLQMELEQYVWAKNAQGETIMGKPIDDYNHLLDPLRYWVRGEAALYRDSIKSMEEQRRQSLPSHIRRRMRQDQQKTQSGITRKMY